MFRYIFQDYQNNKGQVKIIFILSFFRLVNLLARRKHSLLWWLGIPLMVIYRVTVEYILCVELPDGAKIGAGSIVIKDVPPDTVVVGNLARIIDRDTGESHAEKAKSE